MSVVFGNWRARVLSSVFGGCQLILRWHFQCYCITARSHSRGNVPVSRFCPTRYLGHRILNTTTLLPLQICLSAGCSTFRCTWRLSGEYKPPCHQSTYYGCLIRRRTTSPRYEVRSAPDGSQSACTMFEQGEAICAAHPWNSLVSSDYITLIHLQREMILPRKHHLCTHAIPGVASSLTTQLTLAPDHPNSTPCSTHQAQPIPSIRRYPRRSTSTIPQHLDLSSHYIRIYIAPHNTHCPSTH